MTTPPSWAELRVRMALCRITSARGVLRHVHPEGPGGGPREWWSRFFCRVPGLVREENADGEPWRATGPDGTVLRTDEGTRRYARNTLAFSGSAEGMVWPQGYDHHHPGWTWPDEAPVVSDSVAGRAAWRVELPPMERRPAQRLWVDDETGMLLRTEWGSTLQEIVEIELDVDLPDALFRWDGPVDEDVGAARRRAHSVEHRLIEAGELPVPRWWPEGYPAWVIEGDPFTGAVLVAVEVGHQADFPGEAHLGRSPLGTDAPTPAYRPDATVVRWEAHGYRWALCTDLPLSEADRQRVMDSVVVGSPDEAGRPG